MSRYYSYFSGEVFTQKVPVETGVYDEEPPLMFPVGLNLAKMLTLAQADSAFGEWQDQPIIWGPKQDREVSKSDKDAVRLCEDIMDASNSGSFLWEHELDRNIYGGGVFKVSPVLNKTPPHIKFARIPRASFLPIWDPEDPDNLLEVYISYSITKEQAWSKYRYRSDEDIVNRVEHWTLFDYENLIDGKAMKDYSGKNPWGIVPFVFTPRYRVEDWYGESLVNDVIPVQDELNMRIADVGDAINYNAHPVRWGRNLPRDFSAKNFPLGPNSFWNLGRVIGNSPAPEVGILEASQAVSPGVYEYVRFIYDWGRTSASSPPIAFGEDTGGGQRSGATLEIRMWPLIKAIRRSRSYMSASLKRGMYIAGLILKQKGFSDVPARAIDALLEKRINAQFHNVLPRDQAAAVDEVVKLMSTDPKTVSLETSQVVLGRGTGEVERIMNDAEIFAQMKEDAARKQMEMQAELEPKEEDIEVQRRATPKDVER